MDTRASPDDPFVSLTLPEIADWPEGEGVRAVLPALQRGAVWKAEQTERLWDSILRGFPIGSFLLSRYLESLGRRRYKAQHPQNAARGGTGPNYHLLDGQQRATAIQLGFYNPWRNMNKSRAPVLWIDLIPVGHDTDSQAEAAAGDSFYAVQLISRSNPWGYRRGGNAARLHASQMRAAVSAWKALCGVTDRPNEVDLRDVFPWDVKAPIPLSFLLEAATQARGVAEIAAQVLDALPLLPFWKAVTASQETPEQNERDTEHASAVTASAREAREKFSSVVRILTSISRGETQHGPSANVLRASQRALENTRVPAPVLDISDDQANASDPDQDTGAQQQNDKIEILFQRINKGGTQLDNEEIKYSLLKAAWRKAPEIIEDHLLRDHQIASPARLVSLLTRLFLARESSNAHTGMPGKPTVANFRSLMRDPDSRQRFEQFCEEDAKRTIDRTWNLLTGDAAYELPAFLAADLSSTSSENLLLVIMRWIDEIRRSGAEYSGLTSTTRARTLGFITAVTWFAQDVDSCARELWQHLNNLKVAASPEVMDFFNRDQFNSLLRPKDGSRWKMIPLPSPGLLRGVLREYILSACAREKGDASFYEMLEKKELWKYFAAPELTPDSVLQEYQSVSGGRWQDDQSRDAWWKFIARSWWYWTRGGRRLVLFAQRKPLNEWFAWYDPTRPDQIEDRSLPWDYDHIVPNSWVYYQRDIPKLLRNDIMNCIGNIRLWPMELNRSDSDDGPDKKLRPQQSAVGSDRELIAAYIPDLDEIPSLSFAEPQVRDFCAARPPGDNPKKGFKEPGPHQRHFVAAVVGRYHDLYKEWYEQLRLAELMPQTRDDLRA